MLLVAVVTLEEPPTFIGTHRSTCWNGALLSDKKLEMVSRNFPSYSGFEDSNKESISALSPIEENEDSCLPASSKSSAMDPKDAEYHMKRCVDSGLWNAEQ